LCISPKTKSPLGLGRERASTRVSLAVFVTRPQAEHQIGAARGILPINPCTVNGL
jgi:hypothetical protein